jgi:hypothetical protein
MARVKNGVAARVNVLKGWTLNPSSVQRWHFTRAKQSKLSYDVTRYAADDQEQGNYQRKRNTVLR